MFKAIGTAVRRSGGPLSRTTIRCFSTSARAATYTEHGQPENVITLSDQTLDDPTSSQVLIKMLAAPINPSDFNMIEGVYPIGPRGDVKVGGNEGVGQVVSVGDGVTDLKEGDWVIPASPGFGTWRSHALSEEKDLQKIRNDIPAELAATVSVNPATALRMLSDFEELSAGDVVIQNCANSAVGQAVIQLANQRGIKTINIIRDRPDYADVVELLKEMGGDIVVSEDYVGSAEYKTLVSDLPKPKLGLNGAGGRTATEIARCLGEKGTFVTYGGMSRKPVTIPTSLFIFKDISLRGFWISHWTSSHSKEERAEMLSSLTSLIKDEKLSTMIERHDFNDINSAITKVKQPFRERKIVLTFGDE